MAEKAILKIIFCILYMMETEIDKKYVKFSKLHLSILWDIYFDRFVLQYLY